MKKLTLKQVGKNYGSHTVITSIDLHVDDGEFVVFVGPSGCGKSTLLRMIAGLESVTHGEIYLKDRKLNYIHPSERGIAMVFQSYALYPHMTVEKNMAFPLKMSGLNKQEISAKVQKTAEHLQLTPFLNRLPSALSGGQRQRVAIGRAIVRDPEIFLFDEPLSNLDAKLRGEMRIYLKQLHRNLNATIIYVTHDQVEAMTLADKIVVLNKGRIEQIGTPETLYHHPANQFVASFIGSPVMNFIETSVISAMNIKLNIEVNMSMFGIRPNQVKIDAINPDWQMNILLVEPLGHTRLYYGELNGTTFLVESEENYPLGGKLPINLAASVIHCFDKNEQRIDIDKIDSQIEETHAA